MMFKCSKNIKLKVLVFLLETTSALWPFSCPRGNHNGVPGDECSVFCQCKSPAVCEIFRQRCVGPSGYKESCHWTKPCRQGLSCQPGVQRCFNVPRRLHEPCSLGYACDQGLSCAPGFQVCYNHPRLAGQPCSVGYPCASGLSCHPGIQKCYHEPRLENEPCSAGFGCAPSLSCSICGRILLATCQMARVPPFSKQDLEKAYNKVAFLVTHNSFSYGINFGIWARNQRYSVAKQLQDGVRGLMLDIFTGWSDVDARLCHASCLWSGSADLVYTLREVRDFLVQNPHEVVTIIFEDYLRNPRILAKVFDEADISKFVLTSEHWKNDGDWPTLSDMISLDRRLIVFNNVGLTGFPYSERNMWNFVIETRYGGSGKNIHECRERVESESHDYARSLLLVNWFTTIPNSLSPCLNHFDEIKRKLTTCYKNFKKWANFVAVDYYSKGSNGGAFRAVQWLNERLSANTSSSNLETLIDSLAKEMSRIQ